MATERTYLHALQLACSPERWERIVQRAVDDAEAGDAKARDWLARYLIGTPSATQSTLLGMAADDVAQVATARARAAERLQDDHVLQTLIRSL